MSETTVLIPKVGVVAFPQSMSGKDINDTVKSLHQKAVLKSVLKFVAKDPALVGLDAAEFYKQLSAIAAFLEKYTSLARAADAGIHGEKVHDLPTVDEDIHEPVEPEEAPAKTEAPEEGSTEAESEQPQAQPEAEEPAEEVK
jgi:hypothetical protein